MLPRACLQGALLSVSAVLLSQSPAFAFQIYPSNGHHQQTQQPIVARQSTKLYSQDIAKITPKKKNLKTFQRYLEIECWKQPDLRELEPVLLSVAESCKQINKIVQRAQTDDMYGAAVGKDGEQLSDNVQGEVQQVLDVLCNTYMMRAFCGSSSSIHSVASEEEDEPRCLYKIFSGPS
jgi:hypothetical protein